jgi:hypothetical protein
MLPLNIFILFIFIITRLGVGLSINVYLRKKINSKDSNFSQGLLSLCLSEETEIERLQQKGTKEENGN